MLWIKTPFIIEMLVLATILFIVLSPGMVVTLPPKGDLWMSEETSNMAVLVHGALFFAVIKMIASNTFGLGFLKDVETQITGSAGVSL